MIGRTISHYRILEKLGQGGMGEVYLAQDTVLPRKVALKFLSEHMQRDETARKRFLREAESSAAIDHPFICNIFEIGESESKAFLVLEYVEGPTLAARLADGPLPLDEVLRTAAEIAEALQEAHAKGILHRDLKPSNIMFTSTGHVKIMDFGLAKLLEEWPQSRSGPAGPEASGETLTAAGSTIGTPYYMSPEQVRGETLDARSDLFALGVLLYEMTTAVLPFKGGSMGAVFDQILHKAPTSAVTLNPELPAELLPIIERTMEKGRDLRYQSAGELLADLKWLRRESDAGSISSIREPRSRAAKMSVFAGLLAALVVVALGISVGWLFYERSQVRWAQAVAILEIERLVGAGSPYGPSLGMWQAHELAQQAADVIPDDPVLHHLWSQVSREVRVETDPPGARVYAKPYPLADNEWALLGTTPIESVRLPFGYHRLRIEKDGYTTFEGLAPPRGTRPLSIRMLEAGSVPEEMVVISGGHDPMFLPGLDHLSEPFVAVFMDRCEVTNRDYKQFVAAGGYADREYWQHPFVADGRALSWEEAMTAFVDKTARPGPSTWEIGDYPTGQGEYPVSGVSWYEAAAYAAFAKKDLPTIFHWNKAASTPSGVEVVPVSNLGGSGPQPVGSSRAMNAFGTYDMAGNVREWVFNSTGEGGRRYLLGGGWADPDYGFMDTFAQSAFDRSPSNGIRLIRYMEEEANLEALTRPLDLPFRDFLSEAPVSDETFRVFVRQFGYDEGGLDAKIEEEIEEEDWVRQKVSFNAAYGGERMRAMMMLPKMVAPPFQAVIVFPGSGALHRDSPDSFIQAIDFLVKGGRAAVLPSYKGTYERQDELKSDYPDETNFWKNHNIMWVKDFARTIDYLETRDDVDATKLAYYGFSWGGTQGAIIPAVEKRLKASVLYNAGLIFQKALPEVDQINYVGRVTLPVLMINSQHDFVFSVETSQRPLFELLGTSDEHKKWVVYSGSHWVPRSDLIRETLAWLDRYLGPVGR